MGRDGIPLVTPSSEMSSSKGVCSGWSKKSAAVGRRCGAFVAAGVRIILLMSCGSAGVGVRVVGRAGDSGVA